MAVPSSAIQSGESEKQYDRREFCHGVCGYKYGTFSRRVSAKFSNPALGTLRRKLYFQPMSKAKKLLHTRYRVNDLERTVKFYKEVLGLEEVRRNKSPRGSELAFLKAPGSEELIEITYFPGSGPVQVQPDLTHLAFEVDNLEEFGKHLEKSGLKFSDGPTKSSTGSTFAFIDAPEGYEIELIQPPNSGSAAY